MHWSETIEEVIQRATSCLQFTWEAAVEMRCNCHFRPPVVNSGLFMVVIERLPGILNTIVNICTLYLVNFELPQYTCYIHNLTIHSLLLRVCVTDAYDREFRGMYDELPPRDKARMRVADRAPNAQTVSCRRLFGNLEF